MAPPPFRFKRFLVDQQGSAHPVGTDSVLLGAWTDISTVKTILDIGTGTGVVALLLAQRSETDPDIEITGVELHESSCVCARRNFAASPWSQRLAAVQQPIQEFARECGTKYDLIVSNPPFFTETIVSPDVNRRLSRTAIALPPGELLNVVEQLLAPGGRFCAVLPPPEGRRLCEWGAGRGLYCSRETAVFSREEKPCERLLIQLERNPYLYRRTRLSIYGQAEEWSSEFRALTSAFYLHF